MRLRAHRLPQGAGAEEGDSCGLAGILNSRERLVLLADWAPSYSSIHGALSWLRFPRDTASGR